MIRTNTKFAIQDPQQGNNALQRPTESEKNLFDLQAAVPAQRRISPAIGP